MRLKRFVAIIGTLAALIIVLSIGNHAIKQSERNECHKWKSYAHQFPKFYLTAFEKAQCDSYGIKVLETQPEVKFEATESVNGGSIGGVASYYDYTLKSGWSSVGHYVCATRDFPRYIYLEVTNLDNGKKVVCYVSDYGPDEAIHPDRVIDLSSTAFSKIASLKLGVTNVIIKEIK